jgi:hypothetical protein
VKGCTGRGGYAAKPDVAAQLTLGLGAGVDQDRVARRSHHEGLAGDDIMPSAASKTAGSIEGKMLVEGGLIMGRQEILRPPPRTFPFNHRIDGDVADPDLPHFVSPTVV